MTQTLTAVDEALLDAVFAKVGVLTSTAKPKTGSLKKLIPPLVETAVSEAWEKIRALVKEVSRKGWEKTTSLLDEVIAFIDVSAAELENLADEFRKLLVQKIHELMQETSDLILNSIRTKVQVGDQHYVLNSVQLQTKLVFSASIEGSLTTLCKFIGSGETVVTGTYTLLVGKLPVPTSE
jgi:hypothetical protein